MPKLLGIFDNRFSILILFLQSTYVYESIYVLCINIVANFFFFICIFLRPFQRRFFLKYRFRKILFQSVSNTREKIISSNAMFANLYEKNMTSRRILEKAAITAGQAYALGQGLG